MTGIVYSWTSTIGVKGIVRELGQYNLERICLRVTLIKQTPGYLPAAPDYLARTKLEGVEEWENMMRRKLEAAVGVSFEYEWV
jgi:hypothetical protein